MTTQEARAALPIVDRVAREINKVSCLAPVTEVAKAALEASHHAELVEALKEARALIAATPQRIQMLAPTINKIDALLAKLEGD
jgi:hypothetical protein